MKRFFCLLVLLPLLMMSGCASKIDLGPGYEMSSKRFSEAMRWQDFRGAAGFLQAEYREGFIATFAPLKDDLHVVEVDYAFSHLDKRAGSAQSELVLKYYLLPSTRIQEWIWEIDWVLIPIDTEQRGTWQVQGASPDFP